MAKQPTLAKTTETKVVAAQDINEWAKTVGALMTASGTSEDIIRSIMVAEDLDDILGSAVTIKFEDIIGVPMTIDKVQLNTSDYEGGLAAYVVMFVTFDDDDTGIVTCGAESVVAQCIRMFEKGYIPGVRCTPWRATKATANGFYPMKLTKAEARSF